MLSISGKVVFKSYSGGFWGIEDEGGGEWLPVEMPEELQKEGLRVVLSAKQAEDYFSIYMWGTPIEIIGFQVI